MNTKKTIVLGSLAMLPYTKMFEQSRRVYSTDALAPTMHTVGGGDLEPKILEIEPYEHKIENTDVMEQV